MRNKFAARIKELRKEKNWTQEQLAITLGYKRAAVSEWETRNKEPEYDTLIEIADIFGVTTDYLLGRDNY